MKKDNFVYVKHILDSIYKIESFVSGMDKNDFMLDENEVVRSGVVRELEVIGEAAAHTESEFRGAHSQLPWRNMIDTRNSVIHEYMQVDYELVWDITVKDLPSLKFQVEKLLKSGKE